MAGRLNERIGKITGLNMSPDVVLGDEVGKGYIQVLGFITFIDIYSTTRARGENHEPGVDHLGRRIRMVSATTKDHRITP